MNIRIGKWKVAGYARTSTKAQDLASQKRDIEAWTQSQGHELISFEDNDISGRTSSRPGIEAVMQAVEQGDVDAVAITEISRIGRSVKFIAEFMDKLAAANVKVVLVNTGSFLDYNTLEGRALISALALAADIEWMLSKERSARGRQTIKERGVKTGPKRKEVSEVVIKALRDQGLSLRQISKEVGVSPATVLRRLRELEPPVENKLKDLETENKRLKGEMQKMHRRELEAENERLRIELQKMEKQAG